MFVKRGQQQQQQQQLITINILSLERYNETTSEISGPVTHTLPLLIKGVQVVLNYMYVINIGSLKRSI